MSTAKPDPLVCIIILNWNNAADTLACLESVFQLDYPNFTVLVVDNGSTDDSVSQLRAHYPDLDLLLTGANLGYAGGNNTGIRYALAHAADYIFVLNNDIVVVHKTLSRLVEAMPMVERCGIATPLIACFSAPDRVWTLGADFDRRTFETRRLHADAPVSETRGFPISEVAVAPGSAMLIDRKALEHVGLMDEDFFLYYEETEWCIRVAEAGCKIIAVPDALVLHKISATLGSMSPIIDYYMVRNRLRLVGMHSRGLERMVVLSHAVLQEIRTILAFTVRSQHGRRAYRDARLRALADAAMRKWGKVQGIQT